MISDKISKVYIYSHYRLRYNIPLLLIIYVQIAHDVAIVILFNKCKICVTLVTAAPIGYEETND